MLLRNYRNKAAAKGDADCNKVKEIVLRRRDLAVHALFVDFLMYAIKALVLVSLLALIKECAPTLPPFVLSVLLLLYALPATIGSMYNIVINRLHKQDLYNENGRLSHYNRRWLVWFGGFFITYLVSALFFVLQSPSWDSQEWLLIWMGIVIYYVVFMIAQYFTKKEFAAKYYKARAIKWSILIAALIATVIYAIMATQSPTSFQLDQIDLHGILNDRFLPFADSPSAFLAECEKLTSYADRLTSYGVNKLVGASYAISFLVKLILGFSVFIGIFSQFGTCLLQPYEIKSVFQLLPVNDGKPERHIELRYLGILLIIWMSFSGLFIWLNDVASKARETSEYTAVDAWIDDTANWIVLVAEKDIDTVKEDIKLAEESRAFNNQFAQKKDKFVEEQMPNVLDQVNTYYDRCVTNVDRFAEWYESFPANMSIHIPIFGENIVRGEFDKQIANLSENEALNESYSLFLNGLKDLYQEYRDTEERTKITQLAPPLDANGVIDKYNIPYELELWPSWESDEGKKCIQEVLLGKGNNDETWGTKDRIVNYINKQRERNLTLIESLPNYFFK